MEIREIAGTKVFFLKETTSTMDVARNLCEKENEFAVVANRQTIGRGRQGRSWISDDGGLWISIVWREIDHSLLKYLFIISAVSIIETLKIFKISAKIKLPNDIYVQNKKIAGVLIENLRECAIIGIGININNQIDDKMVEAISCSKLLGYNVDLNNVLNFLLKNLNLTRKRFEKNSEEFLNGIKEFLIE